MLVDAAFMRSYLQYKISLISLPMTRYYSKANFNTLCITYSYRYYNFNLDCNFLWTV